jgi:drug/metabolite transporter (DMT)-like permease
MQYFALSFISGSTFKLLQGGSIITTVIFSKILLKMVIEKRHVIGCSLAVIGLVIIGLSSLINSNSNGNSSFGLQVLGVGIMLTSLIF